jgi:nucleotide-binding universal stress UspA family protein
MEEADMREDPIVVGYDGSAHADAAVAWGLAEAVLRGLAVHVVTVVDAGREAAGNSHDLTHSSVVDAKAELATLLREAAAKVPEVDVSGRVVTGPVTGTLCDLSWAASMLIVGCRGQGGFGGLHVGSVGLAVAAHAHCPVVVVRMGSAPATGQPVLLGVDDCPPGRLAALFAFEEAAARCVDVHAVRAVPTHAHRGPGLSIARGDEWSGEQQDLLNDVLAVGRRRYPDVFVVTWVAPGSPGDVLARESRQAQLLVVGSRGRGGFHGLLLGSVGNLALHHAGCPVAVVRERPVAAQPPTPDAADPVSAER